MDTNDTIFFYIWRNLYLNKIIFGFLELYRNNEYKEFKDPESLRLYGEKEYITKLKYSKFNYGIQTPQLVKGDIPEWGVLKELDFGQYNTGITNCDIIPNGVEIINFCIFGSNAIIVSELPSSVNTISNVILKDPYIDNVIPNNITSLSFNSAIDQYQFYDIKIPLSVIKLDLSCISLCKLTNRTIPKSILSSFIPSSVTDLTTHYDEAYYLNSKIPIIPETVRKLNLIVDGFRGGKIEKGVIPFGVLDLLLNISPRGVGISLKENCLPESITKLVIKANLSRGIEMSSFITPTSIPSSVTDLHFTLTTPHKAPSFLNIFPKSLTSLYLVTNNNIPDQIPLIKSELPSIKCFKVNGVDR